MLLPPPTTTTTLTLSVAVIVLSSAQVELPDVMNTITTRSAVLALMRWPVLEVRNSWQHIQECKALIDTTCEISTGVCDGDAWNSSLTLLEYSTHTHFVWAEKGN